MSAAIDRERAKYEALYASGAAYDNGALYGSGFHAEPVVDYIRELQFLSALDVGCGRGEWLKRLCVWGCDPLGVDISHTAVSYCRDLGLRAIAAPLPGMGFGPQSAWDLVTAFDVLEHIPSAHVDEALAELARVTARHAIVSVASHSDMHFGVELHVTVWPQGRWARALARAFGSVDCIHVKQGGAYYHCRPRMPQPENRDVE